MKKIISFILVLCISCTTMSVFAFDDMPNDWSTAAMQSAVDNGLLYGADNKLLPQEKLTRAQMATILVRALGATETADISEFTDVAPTAWYYSAMAMSYKMKIFMGDGAGKLNPEQPITRQEAFVVISRAFSLTASTTSGIASFSDGSDVAVWARSGIEALVANGYVGGSNGKLNPNASITRAEFAQVMYNIIKGYADTSDKLVELAETNGNVVLRGSDIKDIENVVINGDLIIGDSVPTGFSLKNVTVKGRLVVRATAEFDFDGTCEELVVTSDNSKATISSDSTIKKITIASETSSFEVLKETTTDKSDTSSPPSTGDKDDDVPAEEDIWTNFH